MEAITDYFSQSQAEVMMHSLPPFCSEGGLCLRYALFPTRMHSIRFVYSSNVQDVLI